MTILLLIGFVAVAAAVYYGPALGDLRAPHGRHAAPRRTRVVVGERAGPMDLAEIELAQAAAERQTWGEVA